MVFETLAVILEPYKDIVGLIAGVVTVGQMFSASFLCYDIYKQGHTGGVPILPFIGGFLMSVLNLKFGFILRDNTMILVNFAGLALNIIYLSIYFNYARNKFKVWQQLGAGGAVAAGLIAYTEFEDPAKVEERFGLIITALMFYLLSAPLFDLGKIIKNKSTEGMPFPLILSGSLVTFMWLLYGIIIRNNFLIFQNLVAFALCGGQLSLFVIYPSKPKPSKAQEKKSN